MAEKHILSKSTFIRGLQCLKSLYLYKNRYFLRDPLPPEQRAKFKRGTNVGIIAQDLFPGGIDLKPKAPSQYRKAVENTTNTIQNNEAGIIYEAGFQYDQVIVFLDVLVKENDGWICYEVKSSKSVSETYLWDAALQYYVISNCGIDIKDFRIVYINESYELDEQLELNQLFKSASVLNEILPRQEKVIELIGLEKEAIQLKSSPKITVGKQCNTPYPCDFRGLCWKKIPDESAFSIVPENIPANTENAVFLYLLVNRLAIPRYNGHKPYQPNVVGFGLVNNMGELIRSMVYKGDTDPAELVTKDLLNKTQAFRQIIVYNQKEIVQSLIPDKEIFDLTETYTASDIYAPEQPIKLPIDELFSKLDIGFTWPEIRHEAIAKMVYEGLLQKQDEEDRLKVLDYLESYARSIFMLHNNLSTMRAV